MLLRSVLRAHYYCIKYFDWIISLCELGKFLVQDMLAATYQSLKLVTVFPGQLMHICNIVFCKYFSKTCNSVMAFDWIMSLCEHWKFLGYYTRPITVIYFELDLAHCCVPTLSKLFKQISKRPVRSENLKLWRIHLNQ